MELARPTAEDNLRTLTNKAADIMVVITGIRNLDLPKKSGSSHNPSQIRPKSKVDSA